MSEALEKMLRKKKGKSMLPNYKALFRNVGFEEKDLLYIEDIDSIIQKVRDLTLKFKFESQLVSCSASSFRDSVLLDEIYRKYSAANCYIFTDIYEYCGAFCTSTNLAFEFAFDIALKDDQHTCFLLDVDYGYMFTINFYDHDHIDTPDVFDVQRNTLIES